MRPRSLWRALLGVENTVIEEIEFDEEAEVVVSPTCDLVAADVAAAARMGQEHPGMTTAKGDVVGEAWIWA